MPKRAPVLAAYQLRRLKATGLHSVGGVAGLHLQIQGESSRSWILRIKVGDRRRDFGLGRYPDVTLEQARDRAREMRQQLWQGIDPLAARREAQDALRAADAKRLTFEQAMLATWKARAQEFKNKKHAAQWRSTLSMYACPVIGHLPVDAVELAHIVKIVEPIWLTKTETASRLRGRIETVLSWATTSGYRTGENPARWELLRHVLPTPSKVKTVQHHAALPWREMGAFMADLRKREGMGARALEFAILTAARSGEVRGATWDEIDLQAKLWVIPAERMKANKKHRAPLSEPAIKLLKSMPRMEGCNFVFASPRGKMLSDMTISGVCRRMVIDVVPHGFRSTFKDWARNCTSYQDEVSELALAHVSNDATRAAYARDELLPQRQRLMAEWAKYCELPAAPKSTKNVVPIGK